MKYLLRTVPGARSALILPAIACSLLLWSPANQAQCTNCTTTSVGGDTVHTFTANGTFTPPAGVTAVQYLVVGGGGGGGGITNVANVGGAGGGGAGGLQAATGFTVVPATIYNIVVGTGGTGGIGGTSPGESGQASSFSTITASGGGGGASVGNNNGVAGASGGGGRLGGTGGNGTAGQGNNGGNGAGGTVTTAAAGGGGGANANGADGVGNIGGTGGNGISNNITGAAVTYAGGGGGGGFDANGGAGGAGGGGTAPNARGAGGNGTNGLGGGGGGAGGSASGTTAFNGGAGGSGVVIIRYTPQLQYFSRNGGTWTGTDRWSLVGCGGATAGTAEPGPGDHATICNGHTITLDTSIGGAGLLSLTINTGGALQMANSNTARALTVAGNITNAGTLNIPTNRDTTSTLSIAGNIINTGTFDFATDGNSLVNTTFTGGGTHTLSGTGAMRFNNLTVNNSLTINKAAGAVTQAGTLAVITDLTLQSGTLNLGVVTTIGGNLVNDGTLAPGTGTVTFNGAAAQSISGTSGGTSFNNLTLNNTNGLTLTDTHNVTVNNTATLSNGRIETGDNYVYIANGSAIAGAGANNFVVGNLRKRFTTGNQTRVFEVGTIDGSVLYAPVMVQLGNVTAAGDLTVTTTAGDHPDIVSSTLDPNLSINRYWTLADNSVTFSANANTAVTFIYNNPADYDTGADFNEFYVGNYNGAWTELTPGTRTATTTAISGVGITSATLPGDYQIAQRAPLTFTCPSGETFVSGLLGSYYDYTGQTFPAPPPPTGPATGTRVDGPVDFNWANAAPGVTGIGADLFAVRWDGALHVTTSGTYQFQTVSDDGVRLWINNVLVIDNWTDHAAFTNTSGNVPLVAGITYSVRLEFYENGGQAEIRLRWGPSGGPFVAIPAGPLPTLGDGLYYCESTTPNASMVANYRMDEDAWTGAAGEIEDSSGNGNHANRLGAANTASATPARGGDPGTCGYGVIPITAGTQAVDTGIDINDTIGNTGTITFWYSSNAIWSQNTARMLFDASNNLGNAGADKHFYLTKEAGGRLRFAFENTGDTDYEARSPTAYTFPANEWHHIAITWNMGNVARLYLDGTQVATSATTTGNMGNTATLYMGDQRMANVTGTPGGYSANSANGNLDEVRIYSGELTPTEIIIDWLATHPCTSGPDHIRIQHDGEGLTCAPEQVLVRACMDSNCDNEYTGDVTTTLVPTGWVGGDTISFNGGSTTAELRITTVGPVTLDAGGTVPLAANNTRCFNGVTETCTLNFVDSGFILDVPNLTACRTSADITITAVKTSDTGDTCAPAFSGNRTVGFWSVYANPATGTQAVSVGSTPVTTTSPGTGINLNFDANAQAVFNVTYPDAGLMQLNARYEGSGTEAGLVMTGNDQFVSVPVGLAVYSTTDCPAGNASCPVFGIAGDTFPLTVRAACWEADSDTDLSDNPATPNFLMSGIPMTHNLIAPAGALGTLGTGTFDFTAGDNGISTFNQTVSEVGVFTFNATPAAGTYFGETIPAATSPNIGRFRPARFTLDSGTLVNRINTGCPAPSFTYMDENLELGFTLTAQNSSGGTTLNYTGAFANMDPSAAADLNFGAIDTDIPTPLSARIGIDNISGIWSNGVADVIAVVYIARDTTPDGPYENLLFGAAPVDSDGVALELTALNLDVDNVGGNDVRRINNDAVAAPTEVRFGRTFVESTSGSELLPLVLPVHIEYYNGTQFVRNTADDCTTYDSVVLTDITFSNRVALPADPATSGNGTFINGSFDPANPIQLNSGGNSGSVDATLIVPPYLQFDWNGDLNFNDNPTGKATFGIFDFNTPQIYTREVY